MAESARVIILEDDFFARDAIAQRLQRDAFIRVVGEAHAPSQVLELITSASNPPHLLLLDLDFPRGIDQIFILITSVRQTFPALKILCLSLLAEPEIVHRAIRAGIDGYLQKNECADGLCLAIEHCLAGEFVATPTIAQVLTTGGIGRACFVLPRVDLPPTMAEHLRRVAYLRYVRGLTGDQIAEEMVLSRLTVDSYLKQIKSILHIATRSNLLTRGFMAITRLLWEEFRYPD
jgi:DNA-binding NarL/FixJ family response regulator